MCRLLDRVLLELFIKFRTGKEASTNLQNFDSLHSIDNADI
jgi:hypothetical protein